MNRRILLAGLLAPTSCRSPQTAYYTLASIPGTTQPYRVRLIELRRPGLAGYLDRPEIVRTGGAYQLSVAGAERWGEPFGDLVVRILAENLSARLPGSNVFTSLGAITAEENAVVELDVQRFDADASGQVVLLAQVAVSRGRGRASPTTRTMRKTVTPAGASTTELVAAMSQALGQLADEIAPLLR